MGRAEGSKRLDASVLLIPAPWCWHSLWDVEHMLHTWPTMISCPSLCPHVTFPSPLVSPDSSVGKESVCNAGDPGSIPGSGRYTREGIGYPLQYSWASLEAQLVKKPPGMQETWVGKIPWRRERLLTPVLWPGEFHGLYNPWGCQESDMTE